MKKIVMFFVILGLLFSLANCTGSGIQSDLKPGQTLNIAAIDPGEALRSSSESWTLALIPDVQTYVKFAKNQQRYYDMMQWIADHREELDIAIALYTGDLVEHNKIKTPPREGGDQNSRQQWEAFRRGLDRIRLNIPVIVCAGNHDIGFRNGENRSSQLNDYFKATQSPFLNPADGGLLKEMWDDPVNGRTLQNAFYQWKAPDGRDFHILSMEFNPRKKAMEWGIRQLSKMPGDSTGIYLTHSYLSSLVNGSLPLTRENYPVKYDSTSGIQVWEQLIGNGSAISMTFSGHIADNEQFDGQMGLRQDLNSAGKPVTQMMFNAQRIGGWHGNGGDGWLRLLEFLPDGETVHVRTYSPWFEDNPELGQAERTGLEDRFSFRLTR